MGIESYITFGLSNQIYGIELSRIREILTYSTITPIPDTKDWVVGVINSRDKAMPLVDLRIRFKTNINPTYSEKTVIIATKISNDNLLGFIVDDIKDIENINSSEILEAKNISSIIPAKFLNGYVKLEHGMIILLNNETILNSEDLNWN